MMIAVRFTTIARLKTWPRALRVLALLSFVAGGAVFYADSQQQAERQLALRVGPPPVRAIEILEDGGANAPTGEVRVRARIFQGTALRVQYRAGVVRRTALVQPLWPSDATAKTAEIAGFAHVAAGQSAQPGTVVRFQGGALSFLGAPGARGTLVAAVRKELEAGGQSMAGTPVAVALYDHPRSDVLTRLGVSPWRSVFYALTGICLIASFAVQSAWVHRRLSRGTATAKPEDERAPPRTEQALMRFGRMNRPKTQ